MKIKAIGPSSKGEAPSIFYELLLRLYTSYASPGTEISLVSPEAPPGLGGWPGLVSGNLTEAYTEGIAPFVVKEAVKAEKEGFDAVIICGEYNVGAEVARHMVNIPVVDTGTASLHIAALIGDRVCVLIPHDSIASYARKLFKRFGMNDFVTSIKSWNIPIDEAWESRKAQVKDKTISLCRTAIEEEGAQVILPFCVVFIPQTISPDEIETEVGVPVIDGMAVSVKMAEMFVNLKIHTSRKAYPYSKLNL
ncbi:aspartate/glutamate racemase family protein [Chloroflexota bacterium]